MVFGVQSVIIVARTCVLYRRRYIPRVHVGFLTAVFTSTRYSGVSGRCVSPPWGICRGYMPREGTINIPFRNKHTYANESSYRVVFNYCCSYKGLCGNYPRACVTNRGHHHTITRTARSYLRSVPTLTRRLFANLDRFVACKKWICTHARRHWARTPWSISRLSIHVKQALTRPLSSFISEKRAPVSAFLHLSPKLPSEPPGVLCSTGEEIVVPSSKDGAYSSLRWR